MTISFLSLRGAERRGNPRLADGASGSYAQLMKVILFIDKKMFTTYPFCHCEKRSDVAIQWVLFRFLFSFVGE